MLQISVFVIDPLRAFTFTQMLGCSPIDQSRSHFLRFIFDRNVDVDVVVLLLLTHVPSPMAMPPSVFVMVPSWYYQPKLASLL